MSPRPYGLTTFSLTPFPCLLVFLLLFDRGKAYHNALGYVALLTVILELQVLGNSFGAGLIMCGLGNKEIEAWRIKIGLEIGSGQSRLHSWLAGWPGWVILHSIKYRTSVLNHDSEDLHP